MGPYLRNVLLLIGATVGAGIFSLPFALERAGIGVFLLLLFVLGYVTLRLNASFADIVTKVKGKHQFPGYAAAVLGRGWGRLSAFLLLFSTAGALIAYASLGGTFLSQAVPVSEQTGGMLFYAAATFALLFAGKRMEALDEVFTVAKAAMLVILVVMCLGTDSLVQAFRLPMVGYDAFSAYGPLLFALNGFTVIPEMHRGKAFMPSLAHGQIAIAGLYAMFAFAAVSFVSFDTFSFPNRTMHVLFNVTGALAVFSPYLILAQVGADILSRDLGFNPRRAVGALALVAFPALLFGFTDFLAIIGLTGGVFIGGVGIMICAMHHNLFPGKRTAELALAGAVLTLGVIAEVAAFLVS
jgi:hypothetical protein